MTHRGRSERNAGFVLNWEVPQKHAQELDSYPLAMMLQLGKKLKLDTQTLVGVQLQDRELRPLQVEDAGWGVGWGGEDTVL